MFNYKDTLILFGRSPFINEIKDGIPILINKYHTMGCNYFVNTFPDVEWVIFYDDISPTVSNKNKIVTSITHLKNPYKKCHKFCMDNLKRIEFYKICKAKSNTPFTKLKSCLNFYLHTPNMAFNWAWQKGFKNVVIAGIDLDCSNKRHFDKSYTPDSNIDCGLADSTMKSARIYLENFVTKYLHVYQLNPSSDINIPKITLEELL